jgi:hypothetical protein
LAIPLPSIPFTWLACQLASLSPPGKWEQEVGRGTHFALTEGKSPLGLLCFAVRRGAQVPGDSRGASDHNGPHSWRCRQPLPHRTRKSVQGCGVEGSGGGTTLPKALWPSGLADLLPLLQISSTLRARRSDSYLQRFLSLQQSFLCCAFAIALGGGCFLLTALHLERDQAQAWQPGTGTSAPLHPSQAWSREPQPSLKALASLFIHSFKSISYTPVVCQARLWMLGSDRIRPSLSPHGTHTPLAGDNSETEKVGDIICSR